MPLVLSTKVRVGVHLQQPHFEVLVHQKVIPKQLKGVLSPACIDGGLDS